MKPVTETGRIREIRGSLVIVSPDRSASCFGCMNMECKTGGLITAENPLSLPLEAGLIVEVVSPPRIALLRQALAAFLPPILGFLAGFSLTSLFFPQAGERAAISAGFLLLFAAAVVVYLIRGKSKAAGNFTVTRIAG